MPGSTLARVSSPDHVPILPRNMPDCARMWNLTMQNGHLRGSVVPCLCTACSWLRLNDRHGQAISLCLGVGSSRSVPLWPVYRLIHAWVACSCHNGF